MAESQQANPIRGMHKATRVGNCLGNLQPFFPQGPVLGERAQLGMTQGEEGTGEHGLQVGKAETLVAPLPRRRTLRPA